METLVIIPARGGSKGIPRKNIRLMNGQALISYAIKNAQSLGKNVDFIVSTDDNEIKHVSEFYGAKVIMRDERLAKDSVTLDPVIYDALIQQESKLNKIYDVVVTLQPTSPLLNKNTLRKAIEFFKRNDYDTLLSVVNRPHLSWKKLNGEILPNYIERLNRQQLPANYLETGAFFITKREFVKESSRLGNKIGVYEVPEEESIDIDSYDDWNLCEMILKRKNIVFRVDGMKERGLGHIYNCIALAYGFTEHNVLLVTKKGCCEGIKKIKETNLPYKIIEDDYDIQDVINEFQPDIWVNDCLDTTKEYVQYLRNFVKRIVTIEDLGSGAEVADAVINAIYDNNSFNIPIVRNAYWGPEYINLRDEFTLSKPKDFSLDVNNILIMFGGTDPSNLNIKLYNAVRKIAERYPNISFNFVTGIGYDYVNNGILNIPEKNIFVTNNVQFVTRYMQKADIAVSSQGRTIFELAAMRVPTVIMAQNERELKHKFAQMENGFLNLGLGKNISEEAIENTLSWLINTPNIRYNMHMLMSKWNFKNNINKIKRIIVGENND